MSVIKSFNKILYPKQSLNFTFYFSIKFRFENAKFDCFFVKLKTEHNDHKVGPN